MAYVQILCICYMTSGISESQKIFKIDFATVSILNIIPKLFFSCPCGFKYLSLITLCVGD